jgi:2-polyprenyl-6-methoxyphenol hydroxylase-like FAD-dependent oxidoreductase
MRAIVVGAGIGGVAAALALQREGIETIVFERAAEPSHVQVGSAMQITPNALGALEWARPGLLDELIAAGVILEHMDFRTRRGDLIADWPVGEWGREAAGGCTIIVRRGDLHQAMLRRVESGTVHFGLACVGFEQGDHEVRAELDDGSVETGDVLIGADGVQSTIRAELLGDGAPDPAGYTTSVGFASWDGDPLDSGRMYQFIGNGMRIVTFQIDTKTVSWIGYIGTRVGLDGGAPPKLEALRAFEDWPSPLGALIEATPDDGVTKMESFARAPVKHWGRGRATMLGDAAHPMVTFGQGANQAIEDAIVLSRSLKEEPDAAAALRAYEAKRIDRVASLTTLARRTVWMLHWSNPVASLLRDRAILPIFSKSVIPAKQKELYAYRASEM